MCVINTPDLCLFGFSYTLRSGQNASVYTLCGRDRNWDIFPASSRRLRLSHLFFSVDADFRGTGRMDGWMDGWNRKSRESFLLCVCVRAACNRCQFEQGERGVEAVILGVVFCANRVDSSEQSKTSGERINMSEQSMRSFLSGFDKRQIEAWHGAGRVKVAAFFCATC